MTSPTHNKESAARGDVSHSFSFSTTVGDSQQVIGSDSLNATFGYLRRLQKSGQRGKAIELTLVAFLIAFAALQAFFAVGLKAT